jgi:hypothetical protein
MSKQPPRGIRNNNPGNIRHGDNWQGLATDSRTRDKDFASFVSPAMGIRALAVTLVTYRDKHGLRTVQDIIHRWAPPSENKTGAYVAAVARKVGVTPTQQINVHDYAIMRPLVSAIIAHENGTGPLKTDNTWYDDATIDEGLKRAGIMGEAKTVMETPEGKAGAVAVTAGGGAAIVGTLADVGPSIAGHVSAANAATNGLPVWVKVLVVALTLVAVGAGAYVMLQKRKQQKAEA